MLRHFRRAGASHSSALDKIHFQAPPLILNLKEVFAHEDMKTSFFSNLFTVVVLLKVQGVQRFAKWGLPFLIYALSKICDCIFIIMIAYYLVENLF